MRTEIGEAWRLQQQTINGTTS